MKLDLLAIDDHTRRQVWRDPETGRMFTRQSGESDTQLREVDTVTIRHTLAGSTSVVVAFSDPSEVARAVKVELQRAVRAESPGLRLVR